MKPQRSEDRSQNSEYLINEHRTSNIERRIKRKKEWRETNNRMTNDEKMSGEVFTFWILECGLLNKKTECWSDAILGFGVRFAVYRFLSF